MRPRSRLRCQTARKPQLGPGNISPRGNTTGQDDCRRLLIGTAKLNGIEPLAYLTDILDRLPSARSKDL